MLCAVCCAFGAVCTESSVSVFCVEQQSKSRGWLVGGGSTGVCC